MTAIANTANAINMTQNPSFNSRRYFFKLMGVGVTSLSFAFGLMVSVFLGA